MASNILSRFLPPAAGEPSIYETLARRDEESDQSDMDEGAGMALDEENLGTRFHDYELNDALADAASSQVAQSMTGESITRNEGRQARVPRSRSGAPRSGLNLDELDDEVPQSLLIEDGHGAPTLSTARQTRDLPPPVPGPASRGTQARWHAAQEQQRLYRDAQPPEALPRTYHRRGHQMNMMDPKEKALWMWANVENLDNFLQDVYDYFVGNGIWSIFLSRVLNLL